MAYRRHSLLPVRVRRWVQGIAEHKTFKNRYIRAVAACVIFFPWSGLVVLWGLHSAIGLSRISFTDAPLCVGWRATYFCHPYAVLDADHHLSCREVVTGASGYCLCEGNITTAHVTCGSHKFTCEEKCRALARDHGLGIPLPQDFNCQGGSSYVMGEYIKSEDLSRNQNITGSNRGLETLVAVRKDLLQRPLPEVKMPPVRTSRRDFVREKMQLSRRTVEVLRNAVSGFKDSMPAYPSSTYHGRGIVIIGGGLKFIVSLWVALHQLRVTGCRLPIEVWFPEEEYPSPELADSLAELTVDLRRLPWTSAAKDKEKRRVEMYSLKAAVLLASSFEEVLFIDADDFVVRDPTFLFTTEEYVLTGALLWKDFWSSTAARETRTILGISSDTALPLNSFESGQMVIHKKRHWRGLLLAMFLNTHHRVFYEVLSCYLGKGDKETFAYGFMSVGEPFHTVMRPPSSLGLARTLTCALRTGVCSGEFTGTSMVQHDLQGDILFLHTNIHKLTMRIPEEWVDYQRRWEVLEPEGIPWIHWSEGHLGVDLERRIYNLTRALGCKSFWRQYESERVEQHHEEAHGKLEGFHNILRGFDFRRMYLRGWEGPYEAIVKPKTLKMRWQHWYQGHVRPRFRVYGL